MPVPLVKGDGYAGKNGEGREERWLNAELSPEEECRVDRLVLPKTGRFTTVSEYRGQFRDDGGVSPAHCRAARNRPLCAPAPCAAQPAQEDQTV